MRWVVVLVALVGCVGPQVPPAQDAAAHAPELPPPLTVADFQRWCNCSEPDTSPWGFHMESAKEPHFTRLPRSGANEDHREPDVHVGTYDRVRYQFIIYDDGWIIRDVDVSVELKGGLELVSGVDNFTFRGDISQPIFNREFTIRFAEEGRPEVIVHYEADGWPSKRSLIRYNVVSDPS